ncbi:amino acid ABC transporter substrate-binding protein [Polynucleobacter paneuropaeus]|jgi:glutamate/aspartate transport system substrate-binding protein|uniref:amino acid ABC transporter substrate-binding protein n=1 Tax=Polynucleobacter paneuropaeus TaxID=2527775 RepID=UPI000DBF1E6E|nr:amino acid ABC transporter substrate-binding protein [Polynucleobacter paneuropaeus]AWW43863.1 amino acid ABC transporter substrate-binding protein [Polynucleobacter paneuropaeus]MBT8526575.1 amino acid ABC transporter substrate-binding protein [Polynucleobacter paneuropaeus]MBT8533237.1 amino acid ABC transporter substrate-binding protein [Polynucleobacter paneuropaeus]MBT8535881.1 amino acid ABC transporter substrate-binding protein [Polynucleobacter paneuropaeus]MBT8545479.1 amino acid A
MKKISIRKNINFAFLFGLVLAAGSLSSMAASPTLDKMKSTGAVTMGVRESSIPMSYTTGDSRFDGYHVEICRMILGDIKDKLGMSTLRINYQPVTSQNRVPLVQNGTVDIECGTTTNNTARGKDVSFAYTLYVEEVRIAVKSNSNIKTIEDLNGKRVASTTGTTSVQLIRKNQKAKDIKFEEVYGKDHADSFLLLESGRADAFVMDGSILAGNIANAKNPKDFKIVGEPLSIEPIAIMVSKNDPEFKAAVDDAITKIVKNGNMPKLWNKWFLSPIPPKNIVVGLELSPATKNAWAHLNDKPAEDYVAK